MLRIVLLVVVALAFAGCAEDDECHVDECQEICEDDGCASGYCTEAFGGGEGCFCENEDGTVCVYE